MAHSTIFFGSFQHYSAIVLEKLLEHTQISLVVTTPPSADNYQEKENVLSCARNHDLSVIAPDTLEPPPPELLSAPRVDFIVVAGYGKLLPSTVLDLSTIAPINLHPSLLPNYRGRHPAEWAILRGENKTGVSLVHMTQKFDRGNLYAQVKIPIAPRETKDSLYTSLFTTGAKLLVTSMDKLANHTLTPAPQPHLSHLPFYARRLAREDGFIPLNYLLAAIKGDNSPQFSPNICTDIPICPHPAQLVDRITRALTPYPGAWTLNSRGKRLKILEIKLEGPILRIQTVQLEGKSPTPFNPNLL